MPERWLARIAALAVIVILPSAANAQTSRTPVTLDAPVSLTNVGIFATPEASLLPQLDVVDRQQVDADADGDMDELAFVDVSATAVSPAGLGRGAVLFLRDGAGWRGVTVASVPAAPYEAAFNWADAGAHRSPRLRVLYSAMVRGRERRASFDLRVEGGAVTVLRAGGDGVLASRAPRVGGARVAVRARRSRHQS